MWNGIGSDVNSQYAFSLLEKQPMCRARCDIGVYYIKIMLGENETITLNERLGKGRVYCKPDVTEFFLYALKKPSVMCNP